MANRKPRAAARATTVPRQKRKPAPPELRAEPFVVELYVDEGNVRSTSVLHVPSNESARWENWNDLRLTNFIRNKAGLPKAAPPTTEPADLVPRSPINLTIRQAAMQCRRLSSGDSLALELDVHAEGRARVASYQACVYARSCEDGSRVPLAALDGLLKGPDGKVCIQVPKAASAKLRPGLYFVSATVEPAYGGKGDQAPAGMLEMI